MANTGQKLSQPAREQCQEMGAGVETAPILRRWNAVPTVAGYQRRRLAKIVSAADACLYQRTTEHGPAALGEP